MLKYLLSNLSYEIEIGWFYFFAKNDLLFGKLNLFICTCDWKQMQRQGQMEKISVYIYFMVPFLKGSVYNIMTLSYEGSVYERYHDTVPRRQCILLSWCCFTKVALDWGSGFWRYIN